MDKIIKGIIEKSVLVHEELLRDGNLISRLAEVAAECISCIRNSGKIIFCGNGGSAADAQHLAAELVGKLGRNRRALPSLALTVNSCLLTALGNDYGFDNIFVRQVEALGTKKDILFGISTSGNSRNVIRAVEKARELGLKTVVFTGKSGGPLKETADHIFQAPSNDTQRVQEIHILWGHIICELVETEFTNG